MFYVDSGKDGIRFIGGGKAGGSSSSGGGGGAGVEASRRSISSGYIDVIFLRISSFSRLGAFGITPNCEIDRISSKISSIGAVVSALLPPPPEIILSIFADAKRPSGIGGSSSAGVFSIFVGGGGGGICGESSCVSVAVAVTADTAEFSGLVFVLTAELTVLKVSISFLTRLRICSSSALPISLLISSSPDGKTPPYGSIVSLKNDLSISRVGTILSTVSWSCSRIISSILSKLRCCSIG